MTAVEWLQNELFTEEYMRNNLFEIFEYAKELEKQQIENTYDHCRCIGNFDNGTEYYNETFKKK
jgi:hypothetical protein